MVIISITFFIILMILLLITSFFFYKKRIKKYSKDHHNKLSLLAVFVMPIIYTILFSGLILIINPIWRSKNFDSNLWKTNESIRYRMVNKIKSKKLLIGKTKNEVIALLGNQYSENCATWVSDKTICYVAIDPDDIGFLDHYEFVVCFNSENIVYKVSYEYV